MPSKHIDKDQWKEIEKISVNETITKKEVIYPNNILKLLIAKGLEAYSKEKPRTE